MKKETNIRKSAIIISFFLGLIFIGSAVCLDNGGKREDIWPSVLLEIGAAIGLAGILFLIERGFLHEVKKDNQATIEAVKDIVESTSPSITQNILLIEVVPTATDRGQEPKMLIRITDPMGDYTTRWSVTLISPKGNTQTLNATWPGAGKIFRARFPIKETPTGTWHGIAIRNGDEKHSFSETF